MSKSLKWLSEKIIKLNESKDEEKLKLADDLFKSVLNEADIYIVLLKETTDEELENNRARAYIDILDNKSYLRMFTDLTLAKEFARKAGCVKNDKELVIKVSCEQFILDVKDAFMMIGLDGILIEDGKYFATISSEELLRIGILEVLKLDKGYDIDFINTVRAIFDIKNKRYRLVAPIKGNSKEEFLNGISKEYPINNELLIFEYYDKYKVEHFFKEETYYLDLDIELFYEVVKRAYNSGLQKVNIVYEGKKASAMPKDILGLLEVITK